MRTLLVLVMLAGCGRLEFDPLRDAGTDVAPYADPPPRWVNGSRLQAVRIGSGDGEIFRHWFDTQLGVSCSFAPTIDGLRCVPDYPYVDHVTWGDASCSTVKLAHVWSGFVSCAGPLPYASDYGTGLNPVTTFQLASSPFAGTVYIGASTCDASSIPGETYYEATALASSAIFAAGREERTRSGNLSYIEYVGDDGSRQRLPEMIDHRHGDERCRWSVYEPEVGANYCFGPSVGMTAGNYVFADPGCTVPLAVISDTSSAKHLALSIPMLCTNNLRIVERGAAVTGAVYTRSGGMCTLAAIPAGQTVYEIGADVSTEYEPAQRVIAPGSTRVRSLIWRTASGIEYTDEFYLWDTQTNSKCQPRTESGTDSAICAPLWSQSVAPLYSDATCATAMGNVTSACREGEAAIHFPDLAPSHTCAGGTSMRIYAYRPMVLADTYELGPGNVCSLIDQSVHPLRLIDFTDVDAALYSTIELRQ